MSRKDAEAKLLEIGAEKLKAEDRWGDTRTGWWLDGVYLGKDPVVALNAVEGH